MNRNVPAVVAGVVGGIVGFFCFFWIARQGFYALAVPGALVGVFARIFKPKSTYVCIVCGVMALVICVTTEWRFAPFRKDDSLVYFLMHIHQLKPLTLIMIAIGTVLGFSIPWNRGTDRDQPIQ